MDISTSSPELKTPWLEGENSGRVQLPQHLALYLKASGPPRQTPSTPVIVIEHGLGGSASEWVAVQRLLARFARVYVYERAGYVHSDPPQKHPTPETIAADLRLLLTTAGVEPPYVLVGHSYGGTLIRQFLADYGRNVVHGMVIVDSAPIITKVPPTWSEMLGTATYGQVVGLDNNHVLSAEDHRVMMEESDVNDGAIATEEMKGQDAAMIALKDRLNGMNQPLGDWPLSVIFCDESTDFRKAYDYGMQHGHGSPEAREALQKRLEDMSPVDEAAMREHLSLSNNSRFVKAEGKQKTHNVHLVDPEFVASEIEWVFRTACRE